MARASIISVKRSISGSQFSRAMAFPFTGPASLPAFRIMRASRRFWARSRLAWAEHPVSGVGFGDQAAQACGRGHALAGFFPAGFRNALMDGDAIVGTGVKVVARCRADHASSPVGANGVLARES